MQITGQNACNLFRREVTSDLWKFLLISSSFMFLCAYLPRKRIIHGAAYFSQLLHRYNMFYVIVLFRIHISRLTIDILNVLSVLYVIQIKLHLKISHPTHYCEGNIIIMCDLQFPAYFE